MSRDALIGELRLLGRRELKRTLERLSPAERGRVLVMLQPPAAAQPKEAPFDVLAGLSPWLLKAIETGEVGNSGDRLSPAARSAVRAALQELGSARPGHKAPPPGHGRSLLRRLVSGRSGAGLQ